MRLAGIEVSDTDCRARDDLLLSGRTRRRPAVPVVLVLHTPVALGNPDRQPKPDGGTEQTDDGSEEDDTVTPT
jgi:hypothetical protein